MVIAVLELTLTFYAQSLKDKRSVVKRVLSRARNEFNVSAAEVDELDNPGGAVVAFSSVGADRQYLEGQMQRLEDFVDRLEIAEIVDAHRELMNL